MTTSSGNYSARNHEAHADILPDCEPIYNVIANVIANDKFNKKISE